ncbi:MAG: 4-alpha-glucanotransferase [Lewinellaceae bacterium]|nr:4-alpha-glucanotransferase [Saprospiraceae bacterium]MCB9336953.1 4-alpha-glucanotransferase [Lewinellaceae bacterium]
MIAHFHINYGTKHGEHIAIRLRRNGLEEAILCNTFDDNNWLASAAISESEQIEYKYALETPNGQLEEHGSFRTLVVPKGAVQVFCQDYWRPSYEAEQAYFSAAFKDVIFKREKTAGQPTESRKPVKAKKSTAKNKAVFQLHAAAIPQHLKFCILGNHQALGNWVKPLVMSDESFPIWRAEVAVEENWLDIEYKYALYDPARNSIVEWEKEENRTMYFTFPSAAGNVAVRTDEHYRYGSSLWKGAGVAIPVFSLRSEKGMGIGEYTDLNLLVDWAVKTGMKLVQVLPVNDTLATKTWTDSYPYAAISVFALHPLYVNVQSIAKLKDKKAEARLKKAISDLNTLETVDFEKVLKSKFEFFKLLFDQEKAAFYKDTAALDFIEKNAEWLKPYAAFCHLRDLNGTVKFQEWKEYAVFSKQVTDELCSPTYAAFDDVAFYYFIQYHAHRQLFGATAYARQHGVVLKGDLPIGIYRHSCDAWVAPHLYNMDGQAGAPPDAYAVDGQNWGFPTYNWEAMAENGFEWWRKRMTQLSLYFDALRIDHILGFFRIWEIPTDQVIGTLGLFNPRLPYQRHELAAFGLHGDLDRYTRPYIRGQYLPEFFGEAAGFVSKTFLDEVAFGHFSPKPFVDTQLKVKQLFENDPSLAMMRHLEKPLMRLLGEVLLIEEPNSGGTAFNPRITLSTTRSYKDLGEQEQHIFDRLYDDYFFKRHDEFWKQQALRKLPALLQATNMLICGEDLGMIPHSVPGVMKDLNILSLEIQRMPKGSATFGEPAEYPYTSVCSPSCHDMPTIRGWWENDYGTATQFYKKFFHPIGPAPHDCPTGIVKAINQMHFQSPSMWAIFPIQDLVGMDARLRRPHAADEQINDPSNPQHYWRFRFHLALEKLLAEEMLNKEIQGMVEQSGR